MEIKFKHIIVAFMFLVVITAYTMWNIYQFMPILATCSDDFAIIEKCGCVPNTWSDAEKYNGKDNYDKVYDVPQLGIEVIRK